MQAEANPPLSASWGCRHGEKRVTTKFSPSWCTAKYCAVTVAVKGLSCLDAETKLPVAHFTLTIKSIDQPTNPIFLGVTTNTNSSCPEPTRNSFHPSDEFLQQRWHPNSTCDLVSQERASSHLSLISSLLAHFDCGPRLLPCLLVIVIIVVVVMMCGVVLCCAAVWERGGAVG